MEILWRNIVLFHSRQAITGGIIYLVKEGSLQFAPTKIQELAAFKSRSYRNKPKKEIKNVMTDNYHLDTTAADVVYECWNGSQCNEQWGLTLDSYSGHQQ